MSLAELLSLLIRNPDLVATVIIILTAACAALGAVGTALESIGAATQRPSLERFGQRMEAVFADLPKLWRGSRAPLRAVQSKDPPAAVSDNTDVTAPWGR